MRVHRSALPSALLVSGLILGAVAVDAYKLNGPRWGIRQVPYYVNPANGDVSEAAAIAAVQVGAMAWSAQSNADFSWYYMGRTSGSSLTRNGKNEVFFRNESDGGVVARTYWWYNGSNQLIDADIVFYDGGWRFFSGSNGCSDGVYIEDIAAHEFGHALGLGHASDSSATMYGLATRCSTDFRTLEADDLAGVEKLYPPASSNAAPGVAISAPANNTSISQGTTLKFSGSASDAEDGILTSKLVWSSSRDGEIGMGGTVSKVLSAGAHTIRATVTDSGGASSSREIAVTVTTIVNEPTVPSGFWLSGRGLRKKGVQHAELEWGGAASSKVDVYRDGVRVATTANDGSHTHATSRKGRGSSDYKVCEAGTTTCSNAARVAF